MRKYIVQYSYPAQATDAAVSDWKEGSRTVKAKSQQDAIQKINKQLQDLGSWIMLDCFEEV